MSEVTKIGAEAPHVGRHHSQVLAEVVNPLSPGAGLTVGYMGVGWRITACHATWVDSSRGTVLVVVAMLVGRGGEGSPERAAEGAGFVLSATLLSEPSSVSFRAEGQQCGCSTPRMCVRGENSIHNVACLHP